MSGTTVLTKKWPVLGRHEQAAAWLTVWTDLGRAPRTIDAYGRGLAEYLLMCEREDVDPVSANRSHIALYVRELSSRPHRRGANVISIDSGAGLANATIQQRLVPVRLFYDFLMEEGLRESNPVGRGRYTPGRRSGGQQRGLVPRLTKLPWIPGEQQWLSVLEVAKREPVRNRLMLALAYDAALRREELCSLRTDDVDPAHRTLRIRAETTKNRLERVVPYSASTGVLLSDYLAHRATISRARGPLFLSESRRNHAQPLSLWTWSKVVRKLALASGVERFSTHTTRHLCLTDLARMGWELHAIASFAGHRHTDSTLQYIHLSGRDLADKLARGMDHIHAWRIQMRNLRRLQYHDPAAPGWRVIARLLGPIEAVNATLDSPPTPHRRRAMLDVIALLLTHSAETGRTYWDWTTQEWTHLLGRTQAEFRQHAPAWAGDEVRP